MKFDGYLICSDHDGTFSGWDGISEENKKAVEYFHDNGGFFTVATGRRSDFIRERYDGIIKPHVPLILANGTMLYDMTDDKLIDTDFLNTDDYDIVLDAFHHADKGNNLRFEFKENTKWFKISDYTEQMVMDTLEGREVSKFVIDFDKPEDTLELQNYLLSKYENRCTIVRAWPTGLEIFSKTGGKDRFIAQVREVIEKVYNVKIHTVIGIGDYENDIPLMKAADIGVAMQNAPDNVKENADIVIGDCNKDGVAKYIYSL
ncbi:MAG: HAD-IIB family hydrolase [Clostridia bacterium]|nr:HAD-IIB family hydrolase [Clostridia bacterium]